MSENPLLKRYRFKQIAEKAARIPRANKIQLLEFYASYVKAAEMARMDFYMDPLQKEPKEYEKALTKITAFNNVVLALGYVIEDREDGGQHDKQKDKKGNERKRSAGNV